MISALKTQRKGKEYVRGPSAWCLTIKGCVLTQLSWLAPSAQGRGQAQRQAGEAGDGEAPSRGGAQRRSLTQGACAWLWKNGVQQPGMRQMPCTLACRMRES